MATNKDRCWLGYEAVPGKPKREQGSCRKKAVSEATASEKKAQQERAKQLDAWKREHPDSPRKAAQHLSAPKKAARKKRP